MTAKTQEELTQRQLQESFRERALELMRDAEAVGVVIDLRMHTEKQQQERPCNNSVIIAPYAGKGPVMLYPDPATTGNRYNVESHN